MAWTHKSNNKEQVLAGSGYRAYVNYIGQADASDLTDYVVFDASAQLPFVPAATEILWLKMVVGGSGMMAYLEWDATADTLIGGAAQGEPFAWPPETGHFDLAYARDNGLTKDPVGSGTTADIVLTTIGGAVGDAVSLQMILALT